MARFRVDGVDDITEQLKAIGELDNGQVADRILVAGAEQVKSAWKESAEKHELRDTGDMIESIGFPKKPKLVGDVRMIDIYPQGKDRKGVRNAEKAFILHYGTSKIAATHWVTDADRICDTTVVPAMQREFDKILEERGK